MDEDVVKKYIEAGRIARIVRDEAVKLIEAGRRLIDVCEYVENRTRELGAAPAFPCNISVNEIAAHYSPLVGDESTIPENAVVKLDIGVHVDGYIADTAVTVSLDDKWTPLLEAVEEALSRAIELVKPGVKFAEVGKAIENAITSRGFKPITNLGGHSLARYTIHAGESIPNAYDVLARGRFSVGKAYAIEPFGTNGAGLVYEGELITIYALVRTSLRRRLDPRTRRVLEAIKERFKTLPFSERWLVDVEQDVDVLRKSLRKLARMGYLVQYPVLIEKGRGIVAQFEHTVVITSSGEVIVTTR
ncbi:type II methionyl aminopeptidase [Pyrodictium abyssi]|uniref:Methionine aminopeptidase n=2 Tax=Pyrodictium TaxID=2308 RepID=A0ABM8IWW7_9CREN|nr:type II methionyl aminopeptidase [Pyrodictium abyssi]